MRFLALEVEAFQAIASAKLAFSPQLNVLYGPNDLGKSTLVTALRAALLVPPKSAEGTGYRSWFHDRNPRVSLTFEDTDRSIWKVAKEFEEGKGSAELSHSKDGRHFTVDCKGREVEETLRRILSWGLEPPGARGRGAIPDSFLVNALLAGQDQVAEIFLRSIEEDGSDSGKRALTKALAAFAQDPLFKRVLDQAKAEVGRYFSETGRKRSGGKSPFSVTGAMVKQLKAELAEAQAQLDQSAGTERAVQALSHVAQEARRREREATALVETARGGASRAKDRSAAQLRLTQTTEALRAAEATIASARSLEVEVRTARAAVATIETEVANRIKAAETIRAEVAAAEATVHRAQSSGGAGAKAVELATAKRRSAELGELVARIEARKEKAAQSAKARADRAQLSVAVEKLKTELEVSKAAAASAKDSVALATAILDYGRWKEAAAAAERSAKSKEEEQRLRDEAKVVRATIEERTGELGRKRASLDAALAILPSSSQLGAFLELESERKVAEAQIGGGVSVTVRPRDELRLHVELDDESPADEVVKPNKEKVLEAERKVSIAIGQMVEFEIVTGSKEGRQRRDMLNKRWRSEVMPALDRAEVSSLGELQRKHTELETSRTTLGSLQAEIDRLTVRAEGLDRQASMLGQSSTSESAESLRRRRDRIPKAQLEVIAHAFESLGADWEREADALSTKHQRELDEASRKGSTLSAELSAATSRLSSLPPVDGEALELVEAELKRTQAERATVERTIAALERDQGTALKTAEASLEQARARLAEAERALTKAQNEAEGLRRVLHEKRGEAAALEGQVGALDHAKLSTAAEEAQRAWAPLAELPVVTPESLAEAESLLVQVRADADAKEAEFHKAEGALSKTGGALQRERVAQLEEALTAALAKEAEVELDAQSWQLLHATLRDAENTEGGHLGRALAEPVAAQFRDLTEGRYAGIELGPQLQTTGVMAEGSSIEGAQVLEALSIGTRDQLASLLRLAIARQLGSTLVLDDHLVHTDPGRMTWFVDALRRTALEAQVLVVTCRPQDYVSAEVLRGAEPVRDLAGGSVRLIDLERVIQAWPERVAR